MAEPVASATGRARGKACRNEVPRTSHARCEPRDDAVDPIAVLEATSQDRVEELVAIRYGRMLVSPFTYLRGSPAVMAADLATTPRTGLDVQICGDAHLLNFGLFATPERNLIFDVNDFDETLPGPWEWDVKRLAISVVVAGRDHGLAEDQCAEAARRCAQMYRGLIASFAGMGQLEVWYSRVEPQAFLERIDAASRRALERNLRRAQRHTNLGTLTSLTEMVEGRRRIIDNPPLVVHLDAMDVNLVENELTGVMRAYRASVSDEHQVLLDRFELVDFAHKVVGVGSVGTRCFVALLIDTQTDAPLFLQLKQAIPSVLEPFLERSRYANHGQRVVVGQRIMQAASDIFLGWTRGPRGRSYYVRPLHDMKGSIRLEELSGPLVGEYAGLCGWALARAHARCGQAAAISGYLGRGEVFDDALVAYALAYADQNERDYATFRAAVDAGRLPAEPGV